MLGGSYKALITVLCQCAVAVRSLNVLVEVGSAQTPDCLLEGGNVILTCNIQNFTYPYEVTFQKDSVPIVPGEGVLARVTSINRNQVFQGTGT